MIATAMIWTLKEAGEYLEVVEGGEENRSKIYVNNKRGTIVP